MAESVRSSTSQAILIPTRLTIAGGPVKLYSFPGGRLERLTLSVWSVPQAEGLLRAKLEGNASVACENGKKHHPDIYIECAGHPANADSANMAGALAGDPDAALDLAEELEEAALDDWYDPCEAEGLDEESGR